MHGTESIQLLGSLCCGRSPRALLLSCRFFLGSHTSVADAEVAATVADLLAADKGHTRSLIPKLYKLYCNNPDLQRIPPLELLQHPKVHLSTSLRGSLHSLIAYYHLLAQRQSRIFVVVGDHPFKSTTN